MRLKKHSPSQHKKLQEIGIDLRQTFKPRRKKRKGGKR